MYAILFCILLRFISNANAGDSNFVRDYFVQKAVRNVVGFSCGDITSMSGVIIKISESNCLQRNEHFLKLDIFKKICVSLLFSFYRR